MRRPPLLKVALLGAVAALLKRRSEARKSERELWNEATAPIDRS
jgi:hypothetical protein